MVVNNNLIPLLDEMLMELSTERLEVCIVPGDNPEAVKDGKMIRAAVSQNPEWYRELCIEYPSTRYKKRTARKDYTKINRVHILKVLERMIKNKESKSMYALYLVGVAESRKELYDRAEELVPWDNQF